jgi:hypothetical protein
MGELNVSVTLTPAQAAHAFWHLGSDGQAEFYAELYRLAGHTLCLQAAWIVDAIADESRAGRNDARDGFMLLQAHACEYVTTAIDIHADNAKRELRRMADTARLDPT